MLIVMKAIFSFAHTFLKNIGIDFKLRILKIARKLSRFRSNFKGKSVILCKIEERIAIAYANKLNGIRLKLYCSGKNFSYSAGTASPLSKRVSRASKSTTA